MLDGRSRVALGAEVVVVVFFLEFKSNIWVFLSFPFVFSYLTICFYVDCQKTLTEGLTSLTEQNTRTNKSIFKKSGMK